MYQELNQEIADKINMIVLDEVVGPEVMRIQQVGESIMIVTHGITVDAIKQLSKEFKVKINCIFANCNNETEIFMRVFKRSQK